MDPPIPSRNFAVGGSKWSSFAYMQRSRPYIHVDHLRNQYRKRSRCAYLLLAPPRSGQDRIPAKIHNPGYHGHSASANLLSLTRLACALVTREERRRKGNIMNRIPLAESTQNPTDEQKTETLQLYRPWGSYISAHPLWSLQMESEHNAAALSEEDRDVAPPL